MPECTCWQLFHRNKIELSVWAKRQSLNSSFSLIVIIHKLHKPLATIQGQGFLAAMEVEVEDDVGSPLYYTSDFSLNKGYLTPYSASTTHR